MLTGEAVRPDLRYVVVGGPAHGTVAVDALTGAFTYTPVAGLASNGGTDSFQVLVTENRFNLAQVFQAYNGDPVHTIHLTVQATSA